MVRKTELDSIKKPSAEGRKIPLAVYQLLIIYDNLGARLIELSSGLVLSVQIGLCFPVIFISWASTGPVEWSLSQSYS